MRLLASTVGRLPDSLVSPHESHNVDVGGFGGDGAFLADLAPHNRARIERLRPVASRFSFPKSARRLLTATS